jgi:hypothetical protein
MEFRLSKAKDREIHGLSDKDRWLRCKPKEDASYAGKWDICPETVPIKMSCPEMGTTNLRVSRALAWI